MSRGWLLFPLLVACGSSPTPAEPPPQPRAVAIGDRAPEIAAGKVTLVMFWATWSAPSKKFHSELEVIWRRHQGAAFAVRAISVDETPEGLEEWKKAHGLTFPIEWDRDRRLAQRYQAGCEPQMYVVDRAGIVRFSHCGVHDDQRIEAEIDSLL